MGSTLRRRRDADDRRLEHRDLDALAISELARIIAAIHPAVHRRRR
jgi:hypothetical protein